MTQNTDHASEDADRSDQAQQGLDVHPGWSFTPQSEYDLGLSGGWGTPGEHLTGPIPKLRRSPAPASQAPKPTPQSPDPTPESAEPPGGSPGAGAGHG